MDNRNLFRKPAFGYQYQNLIKTMQTLKWSNNSSNQMSLQTRCFLQNLCLKSNNLILGFWSCIRAERSTYDNLVSLEKFTNDAFILKRTCLCRIYNLEKAYDTTCRYGMKKDLLDLWLKGQLTALIQSFHKRPTMQVRVGYAL